MKVGLAEMKGYVFVFCSLFFLSRGATTQALSSEYKYTKLILQVGCPSCYLALCSKSTLIHNPPAQIPKALISMKPLKYLGMNGLM